MYLPKSLHTKDRKKILKIEFQSRTSRQSPTFAFKKLVHERFYSLPKIIYEDQVSMNL